MSNNISQVRVTLRGIRPLFWHHFGREAIPLEGQRKEKTGVAGNDPEEWRRTTLVTKEGQTYLLGTYAFSTTVAGAKFIKKGRGSIQADVSATLQVVDDKILVNRWFPGYPNGKEFAIENAEVPPEDSDQPIYLDVRAVVNPQTKGRNVRYRIVASPGWECAFTIEFDNTIVSDNQIHAALRDAGRFVGIGNAHKIGMGRFEVVAFERQE